MSEATARTLVTVAGAYAALGAVFAVVFVSLGLARVDPGAKGAPWTFRLLVLPGCAALWPYLAWRWARGAPPPAERNAHRVAAARSGR